MKTTIRDILDAHTALAIHGGLSLPPAKAVAFAKLTRAIRAEAEIAGEVRQQLVDTHAKKNADGSLVRVTLPSGAEDVALADPAAYRAAHKALLATEVELAVEPLKVADLGDAKLPSDLVAALLGWALLEA
jgi:hypothetical protein